MNNTDTCSINWYVYIIPTTITNGSTYVHFHCPRCPPFLFCIKRGVPDESGEKICELLIVGRWLICGVDVVEARVVSRVDALVWRMRMRWWSILAKPLNHWLCLMKGRVGRDRYYAMDVRSSDNVCAIFEMPFWDCKWWKERGLNMQDCNRLDVITISLPYGLKMHYALLFCSVNIFARWIMLIPFLILFW